MLRPRHRFGDGRVLTLRAELAGPRPAPWRRLEVSGRASLHELHEIIECVFDIVPDAHCFVIDGVTYTDADAVRTPGQSVTAASIDSLGLHVGARFEHRIEGVRSPWSIVIAVEEIAPRLVGQRLPCCVGGEGSSIPPEVESPEELAALREIARETGGGSQPAGTLPFDSGFVDLASINAALARIPKHRP